MMNVLSERLRKAKVKQQFYDQVAEQTRGSVVHVRSPQLVEQRLCLLQIFCVEALGERGVDRREEIERFNTSALIDPQRGTIRCGSKFKRLGVLASCRV